MANNERVNPTAVRRAHSIEKWDLEADVVVVGCGCAGACAAIEAAGAGADVLVIERASGGGGTSANSGGQIYMGGGTPVQKACGFEDTTEEMYKFLMTALGPEPDEAKVRVYCDESIPHFHWLEEHGVPFKRSFYPVRGGTESPTDDCLAFSGGEDAYPFNRIATPAPRGHKPQYNGSAGGFLMQRLIAASERAGARYECDARCETLVVDDHEQGGVVGVVLWQDKRERLVRARRGVVLTAGGFVMNEEMVRFHVPLIKACNYKLGTDGDDGRAIRMAIGAGAGTIRMGAAEIGYPVGPPDGLLRGILVNRCGQRFINEDTYLGRVGQESILHQGGEMYLIVDTAIYEPTIYGLHAAFVEETVAELEQTIGLPPASLQTTVEYYNRFAAQGEDPLFHKNAEFLQPLTSSPFAAFDMRVRQRSRLGRNYCAFTLGGLHTLPTGEVLTADGNVLPGLYAAGRTSAGVAAGGYCSGISLGDGTFFGRKAGRSAAAAHAG
jgi:3-oxo-5alpha-steroid 4-dehydrogenase